jgi:hypothetical protein
LTKLTTTVFICLLATSLIFVSGCVGNRDEVAQGKNAVNATNKNQNTSDTEYVGNINYFKLEKQNSFLKHYDKEKLQFEANISPYSLPLNASKITNYDNLTQRIPLTNESRDMLYKNGFVVIENGTVGGLFKTELVRVNETYRDLKVADVPIFITSDSLLHLYHLQSDETLKRIENEYFYDDLWKLDKALLEASVEDYNKLVEDNAPEEVIEASRRNVAYFAVALSLLEPKSEQTEELVEGTEEIIPFDSKDIKQYSTEIPSFVKDNVEIELRLIEAQKEGISPIFKYNEDYSQYIPRGHYKTSEKLMNYFKAMMWHGRISMLLNSEMITAQDPEKEARIQTIQAFLISDHIDKDKNLQAKWDRIYEVTSFYVGFSDDLGPYEYAKTMETVFGDNREEMSFDNKTLSVLKNELDRYKGPEIYGEAEEITVVIPETKNRTLDATKGFKFIGQRYTPDSYILQNLNPSALNIMSLLGSERSKEHLKNMNISENEEYKKCHQSLEKEFESFDEDDWTKNIYWAQLYALKPLLISCPEGYPTFMQTEAWRDKQLNTALASWTELRHDTILYVKQPYFIGVPYNPEEMPVQGYVEPVPEFYARMLALTKMEHNELAEMKVLNEQSNGDFTILETTLEKLLIISIKELENEKLTDEEYEFIRNFGQNISPMLENVDIKSHTSMMVADVYHSPAGVLEEGTGKLNLIIVAYNLPDGRIVLGTGPIMSYYEFWQPSGERLTDEEWRDLLKNNPPEKPEWVSSFKV